MLEYRRIPKIFRETHLGAEIRWGHYSAYGQIGGIETGTLNWPISGEEMSGKIRIDLAAVIRKKR